MKEKYVQARRLRRHLTLPEWLLWERIKRREVGAPVFRRQYAFGPYILDFYNIRAKLAVEVDGQHHSQEAQHARDLVRDNWLIAKALTFIVFRPPTFCATPMPWRMVFC